LKELKSLLSSGIKNAKEWFSTSKNGKLLIGIARKPIRAATTNNDIIKNPLSIEKLLTEAKMHNIDRTGSTIIYTEYVGDGIVKKLSQAVKEE
jgi:hypothetical protein